MTTSPQLLPGSVQARILGCTCPNPRVAAEIWQSWPSAKRKYLNAMTLYLIHDTCPIHTFNEDLKNAPRYT